MVQVFNRSSEHVDAYLVAISKLYRLMAETKAQFWLSTDLRP